MFKTFVKVCKTLVSKGLEWHQTALKDECTAP